MPTKKVIAVAIICLAILAGVWIYKQNNPTVAGSAASNKGSIFSVPVGNNAVSGDWQNILTAAAGNAGTTTVASQVKYVSSGEGTVTDQLAKDFFSQYILAKQGGEDITDDQAAQIAASTLSNPAYTRSTGPQYILANIHIAPDSSVQTVKAYYDAMQKAWNTHNASQNEDETAILTDVVSHNNLAELSKLDPIIAAEKAYIADVLQITVPKDAIDVHLSFLNAASNVEANTEAIRQASTDAVKSFAGLNAYAQHVEDFGTTLSNLATYFQSKNLQ